MTTLEILLTGVVFLLSIGLFILTLLWQKYEKENKVLRKDREFLINNKDIKNIVEATQELFKENPNFIPYQICPNCGGLGEVWNSKLRDSGDSSSLTVGWNTCTVCEGVKIIPMYVADTDPIDKSE